MHYIVLLEKFLFFEEYSDPRTRDVLFLHSALPLLLILVCYLLFIKKFGPEFMKHRQPYNIDKIVVTFNIVQIILNALNVIAGIVYLPYMNYKCMKIVTNYEYPNQFVLLFGANYLFLKFLDLFDTIFFVLRKKFNQITTLHVYHHTLMATGTWVAYRFWPGGHLSILAFINSIVHTIMYSYYLYAILHKDNQKMVWWKKYVTQIQLAQFTLISFLFLSTLLDRNCSFNKWFAGFVFFANATMTAMFIKFYYITYIKKKQP